MLGPCYIYGYGSETINGDPTLDLRFAPVTIIPNDLCTTKLGSYNAPEPNSGLYCAIGSHPRADTCAVSNPLNFKCVIQCSKSLPNLQGDSGSAMVCLHNGQLKVVGITSYGLGCGVNDMPGAYTSVVFHVVFIRNVIMNNVMPNQ